MNTERWTARDDLRPEVAERALRIGWQWRYDADGMGGWGQTREEAKAVAIACRRAWDEVTS